VKDASIDLGRWAGRLVQVDIEGGVGRRGASTESIGYVGCSAELRGPGVAGPIEFVGWQNEGSSKVHVGLLGPRAFVAPGAAGRSFVYASEGSLWHVLRVPEEATLQLSLTPMLAEELGSDPKPVVPSVRNARVGLARSTTAQAERPPDVYIYLIDTLRADHLGCYGYDRSTSPNIDAFGAEGVIFEDAHTTATWTRPAVATLLSGLHCSVHGAMDLPDKLAEWTTLLSEVTQQAGYKPYCVTTNSHVSAPFGFNQGYDGFVYKNLASPAWVNSHVARFLAKEDPDQPIFMYLHTVEPHSPYAPTPDSRRRFDRGFIGAFDGSVAGLDATGQIYPWVSDDDVEHLLDLYDAEIFDNDRGFGRFLELLKNVSRFDNALIVLVADHGESFAEHDAIEHGRTLNRQEMQVPLIIRLPGGGFAGVRVKRRVSLVDIFPTVLSEVGASPDLNYALPGRDLLPWASQLWFPTARPIYAELSNGKQALDLLGVVDGDGYKRAIEMSPVPGRTTTRKAVGLWDTEADPDEQVDLAESLPVRAAYHEQLLARWLVEQEHWRDADSGRPPPTVEMTEELNKDLRALGYLD